MNLLSYPLGVMLLLSTLATHASDDMLIYSGRFDNGWGDWPWMPHYATNNPVFTSNSVFVASNSMACVPSGASQVWWLKSGTSVDTTIYASASFWLNGGPTGGQSVSVSGELNGSELGGVSVTAPTNSWKQVTISLSALGINNKTDLTGLQIKNGSSTQPFFIDDLRLVAAPVPAVNVSVLANQTLRKVDGNVFGINQVGWDGSVNTPDSIALLNALGGPCLRWPGGSWGDGYHWTNEAWSAGNTSARTWGSFSKDFIALATNTHAQAFIIVNYGTSDAGEAAWGVRMFNITNHCNFKYWEIGNEVGGSWEWDWEQPAFGTNDFLNLPSLANKLNSPTNNISTYLRSQLSGDTLTTLANYVSNPSAYDSALRFALAGDLNNVIFNHTSSIYKTDTNRFAGITFRSVTWTNLALPIPDIGQDLNNRMTLEDAYPELAKITPAINLASNWPNVYLPHDPWTYAMRFKDYYTQMKAADPTIKIGAVADITEDGTENYMNHPVVNLRTGVTHNGWTPVMLAYMRSNNVTPDFLIEHNYGPAAGDTQDLLYSRCWASQAASLRQMLTDYLGDAGTNVTLEATECGTGGDKQCVSLTGGLFYADTIGQILQTEFRSRLWWEMRGGTGTLSDPDPAFYGWRTNSDGTILVDGGIVYGSGGIGGSGYVYPTYYVAKLMPHFAKDGDTVVSATSDHELLATYAVKRTNGTLTMLVINKSSSSSLTANFNLSGYVPFTNATVYSYGIPQDNAARTGVGSRDIQTNSASFQSFSLTFAPFSASVVEFSPGTQPPFTPADLTATASNAAVALTWSAANSATGYIIRRSTTSGGNYNDIATGVTATTYLDTGLINGTTYYYVVAATNSYGVSSNSAEASATPSEMRAYYAFEGNALDSSGNGNNGTPTSVAYVAGKVGAQAAQFNGTSSYVLIPACINNDFSVAMWIKTTDTGGSAGGQWWSGKGLVDGEVAGPAADWGTAIVGGKFVFGVGANTDTTVASSVNVNDGTWHHVTATRNNTSGAMAVYVDGVLRGSGTGATGTRSAPPSLRIGCIQTGNNFLNGTFDDVRLYDHILTTNEIAALMAPPAAPTNLVATAGDAQVALSWSASATAANYYIKRSTTSGSGYTSIATNASLAFTNNGLNNGTLYYFVVSAVNAFGESTNSAQVSARPTSLAPVAISVTNVSGQFGFAWPVDHTGWQLQSQTNSLAVGLSTNWVNVSSSTQTNQVTLTVNPTNGAVFFRLVRPY